MSMFVCVTFPKWRSIVLIQCELKGEMQKKSMTDRHDVSKADMDSSANNSNMTTALMVTPFLNNKPNYDIKCVCVIFGKADTSLS